MTGAGCRVLVRPFTEPLSMLSDGNVSAKRSSHHHATPQMGGLRNRYCLACGAERAESHTRIWRREATKGTDLRGLDPAPVRPCAAQLARAQSTQVCFASIWQSTAWQRGTARLPRAPSGTSSRMSAYLSVAKQADEWCTRTAGRRVSTRLPLLRQLKRAQVAVARHFQMTE